MTASKELTSSAPTKTVSVALIHNWPLTVLCAALLPLLLWLGSWQLQRGAEKARIKVDIDTRLSRQPQSPQKLQQLQIYTPVRLSGYYTEQIFYLDNRTRNGQVGYEILQVFVAGRQSWLINRGWIAAGKDRAHLPEISFPRAAKVIIGFLYPVSSANTTAMTKGPRIQQFDQRLGASIGLLHPQWTMRLSADSDTALHTDWQLINSSPQRHQGYAVQWFAMAAALLLLWLIAATNLRKKFSNQRGARSHKSKTQ